MKGESEGEGGEEGGRREDREHPVSSKDSSLHTGFTHNPTHTSHPVPSLYFSLSADVPVFRLQKFKSLVSPHISLLSLKIHTLTHTHTHTCVRHTHTRMYPFLGVNVHLN